MLKKQGFSPLALIIILAVLGVGGYTLWQKQTVTPPSTLPEASPTGSFWRGEGTPTSPLGGGQEGVGSWKIYTDEQSGFTLEYPSNYLFGKRGSKIDFVSSNGNPVTLLGPILGRPGVKDVDLAVHVINWFGKTDNPEFTIFAKNNMSLAPELDYLKTDLSRKFNAMRKESSGGLSSGKYKGYIFQKNNNVYIIFSIETDTVLPKIISTFKFTK